MKRKSWREHISKDRLKLFERIYEEFCNDSVGWRMLFALPEYTRFLDTPITDFAYSHLYKNPDLIKAKIAAKKKSLKKRRRDSDYLFRLIRKWINMELSPNPSPYPSLFSHDSSRRAFFTSVYRSSYAERMNNLVNDLSLSFENVLCLVTWKFTVSELVTLAILGDDDSLFRLISLNSRFIIAKFFGARLIRAQTYRDDKFFNRLANAIKRDARKSYLLHAKIGFSIVVLWYLGFKDLPKRELLDYLQHKFGYPTYDLSSFNVIVSRLGLTKYKKT